MCCFGSSCPFSSTRLERPPKEATAEFINGLNGSTGRCPTVWLSSVTNVTNTHKAVVQHNIRACTHFGQTNCFDTQSPYYLLLIVTANALIDESQRR
jgi:hypothetical protein